MTTFGVITKIPDFPDNGNLCLTFLYPPKSRTYIATVGIAKVEKDIAPMGMAQWENFRLGELLVIGGDGRDQFTRKPSKWDVTCEEFDNIEDAVNRIRELKLDK